MPIHPSRRAFLPLAAIAAAASACRKSGSAPAAHRVAEIEGSRPDRIHALSRLMTAGARERLIATVLDASILEEQFGDGEMGPSDFRHLGFVKVLPPDIARWATAPGRLAESPGWVEPPMEVSWWISKADFQDLRFFESRMVFGQNGWIAVSPKGLLYFLIATS